MILLYNLTSHPALPAISMAASMMGQSLKHVTENEYTKSLLSLSLGTPSKAPVLVKEGTLPEPMMVFAGMKQEDVMLFLDRLKALGAPTIALKAVMTPTSCSWTSLELYAHLKEEHEYYQKKSKS